MTELAKTFDPAAIEARWYAHWEERGLFRPERPDAEPWTIVMPPPNVTGSLHIGHALDVTLQDILTRHARLCGRDALWVAGTDHAGIATQMVVERQLAEKQDKRTNYSRDDFIAKVWEWKAESGGQITRQLRRLGASCDWANERFTMDPGFSAAVTKVFVDLYNKGLLYRDKRLVNWDPGLKTAISDLEVETREVQGKFWHLRYPLADGSGAIHVATTRPETMLADMAVAVNPADERYTNLIGQMVKLPITGRLIPIVADDHADPELGSGAVKVTPGHDFNDFEVGKRAGIAAADMLNMFDAEAKVVQTADGLIPQALLGLSAKDARVAVVDMLDAAGALEKVEDRTIQTPFGDRSGVVIEPWLTDQWYVDAATLVKPVLEATRSGEIRIVPESWSKTWFNWLENIQPWCVSRQLWWGHRVPALHGPALGSDGRGSVPSEAGRLKVTTQTFVADTEEEQIRLVEKFYGKRAVVVESPDQAIIGSMRQAAGFEPQDMVIVWRDQDVLDTWFSSALWPFATLGWPEKTPDLARHYPNDVLISGFDILFFWDARMAMQGIEFMGQAPWRTLYLHGLVRDAHGAKMSKSKGNTVDPLGLIDQYGADALRFFMASMESQGRDIKMDEARLAGYRNFATKLWNAARFLQGNGVGASQSIAAPEAKLPVNRWIIGEVVDTLAKLDKALADLRFDEAASAIYHFTWATFCDWYVELVKGEFTPPAGAGGVDSPQASGGGHVPSDGDMPSPSALRASSPSRSGGGETRQVAAWAFDQILVMLHPFMPFITEELWHSMGERPYDLIVAKWPAPEAQANREAKAEVEWLIGLITEIRSSRTELEIPAGARTDLWVEADFTIEGLRGRDVARTDVAERFVRNRLAIARLARLNRIEFLNSGLAYDLSTGDQIDRTQFKPNAKDAIPMVFNDVTYQLPVAEVIDIDAQRARLAKAISAAEKDRDSLKTRLDNPAFAERAKPEAVEKARADHDARAAEAERLAAALARLG